MCIVIYLSIENNNFIRTSNRDEAYGRKALVLSFYNVYGVKTPFTEDALAEGSWIGISEKRRVISLLNRGFTNHVKVKGYQKEEVQTTDFEMITV